MALLLYSICHPLRQDLQRVAGAIAVADALCLPSADLIYDVCRTLNRPQPVPHRVTEAVHGRFLRDVWLQPFVQRSIR